MDDKTPPPTPAATNFEPRTGKYLTVTATEFQTRAGAYIERSGKAPVVITKHSRPARVLVDFDTPRQMMQNAKLIRVHHEFFE